MRTAILISACIITEAINPGIEHPENVVTFISALIAIFIFADVIDFIRGK